MEEELTRKGRRKSRPIKLENSTRDDEPMEEDLIRADDEDSLIIAEDKENALGDDGRCHLCSRTFGSKIQLQTHMRLHLNGRGLPCDHCGKQYANKSKLKRHSRSHTGEKPYTCSYCSKNFSRSDNLTTHVLRQHQAARVCACSKCYATYITIADLKDHRDSCHPGEAVFQCALCEEVKTETGEMLEEHLKTKHEEAFVGVAPANDDLMSVDEPVPLIVQPVGTSNNMDTDDSGASSYTKNDISSHGGSKRKTTTPKKLKYNRTMNEESEESASELDEVDSPDNGFDETNAAQVLSQIKRNIYTRKPSETRPINLQSTDEKRYLIKPTEKLEEPHRSDSPASFSSKGSVEQQWPNAVSCEVCQLLLKDTQYLQRHLQRKHHDGIDYFCPKCPERQTTLTGLIDHVRVQHLSSEEPYCSDCNEAFPSKVDLQLHIRQHRVHQCHFCPKQFTLIHKLHSHLRRHTEQKLYCCDICRKEFNRSDLLQAHVMRSHGLMVESFCCRICKKKFANEDQLIEHSRGHCRQKCKVCNESFSVLSEMRKHLIVHADQLPHGCKICGDRYQDKDGLEQHIKSHVKAQNDSNSHPGDDSSESGISGDESLSGKSLHCCGLCAATCHSVSNLILHMDTEHQSVDKRRLWDLLMETLHNEKQQKDQVPDDVVCVQPTEPDNKVLTPVNDNIRKEKPIPLLLNPMQPLIMNQSLVVGGLNTWYTMEKKMPGLIPKPSVKEKQEKLETIAMDLTSKKTFSCSQCKEKLPGPEELAAHEKTHENGILNVAKYRCDSCPAAFETQENLDAHTRNHENNAQARCYICNQDMSSQTELLKHLMLHRHTSYHCKVCGKSLSSWSKFEAHMGTHDDGAKFACCFCDIQFMEKTRLVQHLNDVHDRNDSQICGACGKIYFDHNLLASHMKEHEDDDMTPPPEVKPIVESKADDIAIECEFCPLVFDGINSLTDHMITHKNVDPGELNTAIQKVMLCHTEQGDANMNGSPPLPLSPPSADAQQAAHPRRSLHACPQCDQTFSTKQHLLVHAKSHLASEFPFPCKLCEKSFKTKAKLQRHLKTHTGETPHTCTLCGKSFARKDNLKVHLNTAHTGADATQCPKCSKCFDTPYALRQHMRWHTDKKYECSICGTSFTWKCYLVRHMKSRHPEMAEY